MDAAAVTVIDGERQVVVVTNKIAKMLFLPSGFDKSNQSMVEVENIACESITVTVLIFLM